MHIITIIITKPHTKKSFITHNLPNQPLSHLYFTKLPLIHKWKENSLHFIISFLIQEHCPTTNHYQICILLEFYHFF
jgi:hypothetical protein